MSRPGANDTLQLLQTGTMEIKGVLPWSSNYAFLAHIGQPEQAVLAVYKPRQGERPLWDFASGTLCQRETAAFVISHALGWDIVPPTVLRQGTHGIGSVQLFINHDPECHYFTFEGEAAFQNSLQQIVLLDVIINNADRKGGHVLLQESDDNAQANRLWAIDHGICFHSEYKLRTVIWEFAGTRIPDPLLADLIKFQAQLHTLYHASLKQLLTSAEFLALERRLDRIIETKTFIKPGSGRHYPWPPV